MHDEPLSFSVGDVAFLSEIDRAKTIDVDVSLLRATSGANARETRLGGRAKVYRDLRRFHERESRVKRLVESPGRVVLVRAEHAKRRPRMAFEYRVFVLGDVRVEESLPVDEIAKRSERVEGSRRRRRLVLERVSEESLMRPPLDLFGEGARAFSSLFERASEFFDDRGLSRSDVSLDVYSLGTSSSGEDANRGSDERVRRV